MANNKKAEQGLVTAYESNSRVNAHNHSEVDSQWTAKINQLLLKDYSFLPVTYASNGVLFRGMQSGILESLRNNEFLNFESSNPHSALEKELDVYFVSHELSDALTVARLWEQYDDGCLLVLSSDYFRKKHAQNSAAVLAFSEPGFVFNYPFLTDVFKLEDFLFIIVNEKTYNKLYEKLDNELFANLKKRLYLIKESTLSQGRAAVENTIKDYLNQNNHASATLIEADHFPKK